MVISRDFPYNTVDGSEIPFPTTWDGAIQPCKIIGFQLPSPQLVSSRRISERTI